MRDPVCMFDGVFLLIPPNCPIRCILLNCLIVLFGVLPEGERPPTTWGAPPSPVEGRGGENPYHPISKRWVVLPFGGHKEQGEDLGSSTSNINKNIKENSNSIYKMSISNSSFKPIMVMFTKMIIYNSKKTNT